MSDQTMVFSMPDITSEDGEIHFNHHTSLLGVMNQSADFATIKLNGKFIVKIGHGQVEAHFYNIFEGDYVTFELLTPDVNVSVYALG